MRIDVKKFLFVGLMEEKDLFFAKAQEVGLVHFIQPSQIKEIPQEIQDITLAIKVLRGLPVTEQVELENYSEAANITAEILKIKHTLDKLGEEQRIFQLEAARIAVYGDFSLDDIAYIEKYGYRKIQFFFAKQKAVNLNALPPNLFWVGTSYGLDYFVSINPEPVSYDKLIEMHILHSLSHVRQKLQLLQDEITLQEQKLKTYAKYNTFLHHALVYKLNKYNLRFAQKSVKTVLNDALFAVEGWVPADKTTPVQKLVKEMDVDMQEIAIEPKDAIPTYLENDGVRRVGEDLVHIYDTPSHRDKDPSIWVLSFFALFFAMIIGDAGYGVIFLMIAGFLYYKFPRMTSMARRMVKLLAILGGACLIWGIAIHSWFGIEFSPDSSVSKFSMLHWISENKAAYHIAHKDETYKEIIKSNPQLENVSDPHEFLLKATKEKGGHIVHEVENRFNDNFLLEAAILLGIIHLTLSFLRYIRRNWAGIGWIIFIWGAYFYFPSYLQTTSLMNYVFGLDAVSLATNGWYMMWGGLALAVGINVAMHGIYGALDLMHVIQIFADVLSYLRIYALGLAGAIVSGILLQIASSSIIFLGILLLIIGHMINIALSVMSGVIHGLRLNFIEWYHYSFEGGGKMFNPLRKIEIEKGD